MLWWMSLMGLVSCRVYGVLFLRRPAVLLPMDLFAIITLLVVITALFSYWNTRFLKLPDSIGLTVISLVYSLVIILAGSIFPGLVAMEKSFMGQIDFSEVLLDVMLCFLLFAGAFHTNFELLKKNISSVTVFSVLGVLISTAVIGSLTYFIFELFFTPVPWLYCLLFGAIISPTDPIAVLSILTRSGVPEDVEINIVGESLFNDGVGVVLFYLIISTVQNGIPSNVGLEVLTHLVREAGGGILLGWALGMLGFYMLRKIDHYQSEVMITLALAMGGYELASVLHVSGPLCMVAGGLVTGHRSKAKAMSRQTAEYVDKFWVLIDGLLNAMLFVLIGLELVLIEFRPVYIWGGLMAIPITIIARFLALWLPYVAMKKWIPAVNMKMIRLMTWGGLRGGLSIAMALSLKEPLPREGFVVMVFIVMAFSIIVQGLTVGKMARRLFGSQPGKK
jgi:CPA1 family monovalent cation:H+ antiporter